MGRKYKLTQRIANDVGAVWAALPAALEDAGIKVLESDKDTLEIRGKKAKVSTASVGTAAMGGGSFQKAPIAKTFGEKITAQLSQVEGGCELTVESRLRFGLVDWGENRKNVENIQASLRSHLP